MLRSAIVFAVAAIAAAMFGSSYLPNGESMAPAAQNRPAIATPAAAKAAPVPEASSHSFRETTLRADAGGQYAADILVNGSSVRMLVDTGATVVSISAATADRVGATALPGPKWEVQTANGKSVATPALLRELSFGGIYMRDVEALILAPEAGDVNLLGASFLKRLASVEQRNGVLVLRQ